MSLPYRAIVIAFVLSFGSMGCHTGERERAPTARHADAANIVVKPLAADANAPIVTAPIQKPAGTIRFGDSVHERENVPFFPGTTYDAKVPHPDTLLRQPLGTFTAHHAEIMSAMRAMAAKSDRMRVVPIGRSHEGRELLSVVIASSDNMKRIDAIRADIARLADPRGANDADVERIVKESPAIAWLGYSIHGDEMSGADASLAVAYYFAAGTSADVTDILKNVVVVIDPVQNPDGRERVLSQIEQSAGYVANLDYASMQRGRWPYGRENHYYFDMNRDWLWGTQPETRARWSAINSWHPQLLVDAHEMGSMDTFLFYPATDPLTPHFPEYTKRWWPVYGNDQAAAFDRYGWSYYTREWADSWYPGYTDSWGTFIGACGILYEQARYRGQSVRRASGEIATYHDAVHRQSVGSVANVRTLAQNREAALREYVEAKRANCAAETAGNERMFVLVTGRHPDRERKMVANLVEQGIEVWRADEDFRGASVKTVAAGAKDDFDFKAGALIVRARQPLAPLVKAMLEFDPRYDKASLERERKELERKQRSKAYDVTAWSPAHAYDLDAYWCNDSAVQSTRLTALLVEPSGVVALANPNDPVYGWIVDGTDDGAVRFAAAAMELGCQLNLSDEGFRAAGRSFARGSLLVRRTENTANVAELVARAASRAGVSAYATSTARSRDESADLGGRHFDLLARPRIAILSNTPISSDSFGHAWHLIDTHLQLPSSHLDAQNFGGSDLRRYNVLVVPEGGGSVISENAEKVRTWVRSGGTLIALGGAAADLCDKESKFTAVRERSEVLDDLDKYAISVKREREAGTSKIDEAALYDEPKAAAKEEPAAEPTDSAADPKKDSDEKSPDKSDKKDPEKKDGSKSDKKDDAKSEDKKRRDRYLATFSPQGVILRGEVNEDVWITAGCSSELPVFFEGSSALLSELPVRTAVRIASIDRMRLSGLLWPEARERIADSAYCTVERMGSGQVILFASSPVFRDWFRGTARLLANAIVYGPGAGASQPTQW
ncbi:MAG: M14 family metallopeptidase [Planctomycetota bacterium]|nr:M14 family metallopeptidase [Planctomycetota bacterium]